MIVTIILIIIILTNSFMSDELIHSPRAVVTVKPIQRSIVPRPPLLMCKGYTVEVPSDLPERKEGHRYHYYH